jgi:hypothetical protein
LHLWAHPPLETTLFGGYAAEPQRRLTSSGYSIVTDEHWGSFKKILACNADGLLTGNLIGNSFRPRRTPPIDQFQG